MLPPLSPCSRLISIATEPLADPPLTKVFVSIDCCNEKEALDEDDEEWRYRASEPIAIESQNSSPITLKDFVTHTHTYLIASLDQIIECEDELYTIPQNHGNGASPIDIRVGDADKNIPKACHVPVRGRLVHRSRAR